MVHYNGEINETEKFIMRLIRHFNTVTKHKYIVLVHCIKAGIFWQGIMHDMSKFSPIEFFNGAKYFTGDRSPTEFERREYGCSYAWMHHKGRNRHHFEYWTDYNPQTRRIEPVKMPIKYVKEMFCDRVAAGKVYLGKKYTDENPIGYFLGGTAKNNMHAETAELLGSWLELLKVEGEKNVFKKIRETKEY